MAETKIEWTATPNGDGTFSPGFTFNPWRGCAKVSPGCAHCYAEAMSGRNPAVLGEWGPEGKRVIAAESYWRQPLAWDRRARREGRRLKVFCASLADVFEDRPELTKPRCRLLRLIHLTPHLDWLLLTKRPEGIRDRLHECSTQEDVDHGDDGKLGINDGACLASQWKHGSPPPNAWLGVSVEDQQRADERVPLLLKAPAAVRFLSCEPLLGPVNLTALQTDSHWSGKREPSKWDCLRGFTYSRREPFVLNGITEEKGETPFVDIDHTEVIDWVIVGGESGPHARPCELAWVRSLVRQCREAGAACFVKQLGAAASDERNGLAGAALEVPEEARGLVSLRLKDPKGGDVGEWPEDLRVRQFPEVRA